MAKTYAEKLLDPKWQKKRLEILQRDNFTCQGCLDKESTLHVHHKTYIKGREPWDYDNYNFITLCETCHEIEGKIIQQKKLLKERLEKIYPNLPQYCPACGCEEVKMYEVSMFNCPLCGHRFFLSELNEERSDENCIQ
jgi:ribosomal protein L37AE/L43A